MAADPLSEHLVLSEEPPAQSSPAAAPRQVHLQHHQVQQPEQCYPPPPSLPSVPPAAARPGTQARRGRDGDGGSHRRSKTSLAQITVNPASAAASVVTQGHHGGYDHLLRPSCHPASSSAPRPPPTSSGLRFNVLQQHHGRQNTSELVPAVTQDDEEGPTTTTDHNNGVNNNNGRQVRPRSVPGYGGGDRGGSGLPHSVGSSVGRKQDLDIGECGKKMCLHLFSLS